MEMSMVRVFANQKNSSFRWNLFNTQKFRFALRSFLNASEFCSSALDCAGISEENRWFYTHSKAEVVYLTGVTSWMKGTYWTDNFVARVSWEAKSPKSGLTGYMDPMKVVGAMGHHTVGSQCFTQSDCITKMRIFQKDDMDNGFRSVTSN